MLTQDVGGIVSPSDVCEHNKSPGDYFTNIVEGEQVVPLMELAIRLHLNCWLRIDYLQTHSS